MKKNLKLFALPLFLILVLGMTGCGRSDSNGTIVDLLQVELGMSESEVLDALESNSQNWERSVRQLSAGTIWETEDYSMSARFDFDDEGLLYSIIKVFGSANEIELPTLADISEVRTEEQLFDLLGTLPNGRIEMSLEPSGVVRNHQDWNFHGVGQMHVTFYDGVARIIDGCLTPFYAMRLTLDGLMYDCLEDVID